jgi:hypothetical protein
LLAPPLGPEVAVFLRIRQVPIEVRMRHMVVPGTSIMTLRAITPPAKSSDCHGSSKF